MKYGKQKIYLNVATHTINCNDMPQSRSKFNSIEQYGGYGYSTTSITAAFDYWFKESLIDAVSGYFKTFILI